ncbi:MAG: hypothetical protein LBB15_01705 [Puniceicoccales bacterium]|jgi:hypothetical protein|nr:hypothetical protein [Puniceicoccales bacterium]
MEQIIKFFGNIAKDKQTIEAAKDGIGVIIKHLDKAEEWIDKVPKDKFNDTVKMIAEGVHEKMIEMVRNGTINGEYLEKMHRLCMALPSDVSRTFENIVNTYYERYKNQA